MSRYIDAEQIAETYLQRARSEWQKVKEGNAGNAFAEASHIALHYPSADVQDVKHGRWIEEDDAIIHGHCSSCGWNAIWQETDVFGMPYCPNCGAKMQGGDAE